MVFVFPQVSSENTSTQVAHGPGSKYWSFDSVADNEHYDSPWVDDNHVYIINYDKLNNDYQIVAIDNENGKQRWSFTIPHYRQYLEGQRLYLSPDGISLLVLVDGGIMEINCLSGTQMGIYNLKGYHLFYPRISEDGKFVFFVNGGVFKYARFDYSTPVWKSLGSAYMLDITISTNGNYVFAFVSNTKEIVAFDTSTGKSSNQIWKFVNARTITLSPDESVGYILGLDDNIYAVDTLKGVQIWKFIGTNDLMNVIVSENGNFLLFSSENDMYNINTTDGSLNWVSTGQSGCMSLTKDSKHVFVITRFALCSFDTIDGSLNWSNENHQVMLGPVTSSSGLVFVNTYDDESSLQTTIAYRIFYPIL